MVGDNGNPFVTTEITLKVADRLRSSILKCYYSDIRKLKRKLTFIGVDTIISDIESKLYRSVFYSQGEIFISLGELKDKLEQIKMLVINKHQSLYIDEIDLLLNKLNLFGFHFATLDIRQNSKIHARVFDAFVANKKTIFPENYQTLTEEQKLQFLANISSDLEENDFEDTIVKSTIGSIKAMKTIQENNGKKHVIDI